MLTLETDDGPAWGEGFCLAYHPIYKGTLGEGIDSWFGEGTRGRIWKEGFWQTDFRFI